MGGQLDGIYALWQPSTEILILINYCELFFAIACKIEVLLKIKTIYLSIFEIDLYEGLALGCFQGAEYGKVLRRTGRYFRSIRSLDLG